MLIALIAVIFVLWILGYINISGINIPDTTLFSINGQPITLWSLLIFLVVVAAISMLPRPLQAVAGLLLILWVLSVLGIFSFIAFSGLSSLLVILIIGALILSLFI